jgi:predicted ATPase
VRQLALLALLLEMTSAGESQFIIATHSPMVMAFPEAAILNFDGEHVTPIPYDEVEHVTLMRAFLQHPAMFLNRL